MIMNDEVSANAIMKRATKHYIVVIQRAAEKPLNKSGRCAPSSGRWQIHQRPLLGANSTFKVLITFSKISSNPRKFHRSFGYAAIS